MCEYSRTAGHHDADAVEADARGDLREDLVVDAAVRRALRTDAVCWVLMPGFSGYEQGVLWVLSWGTDLFVIAAVRRGLRTDGVLWVRAGVHRVLTRGYSGHSHGVLIFSLLQQHDQPCDGRAM